MPKKNIRILHGKPLLAYTIEAALGAGFVGRTVVTTEDEAIAKIALEYGAEVIDRPKELAQDKTLIQPVLEHTLEVLAKDGYEPEIVILLNPTSPLRHSTHIDEALHQFLHAIADTLLTVYPAKDICLWELELGTHFGKDRKGMGAYFGKYMANYDYLHKTQRQDMPLQYRENGAIYIVRRKFLLENHHYLGGRLIFYSMPELNSVDINTALDFVIAEAILNASVTDKP